MEWIKRENNGELQLMEVAGAELPPPCGAKPPFLHLIEGIPCLVDLKGVSSPFKAASAVDTNTNRQMLVKDSQ